MNKLRIFLKTALIGFIFICIGLLSKQFIVNAASSSYRAFTYLSWESTNKYWTTISGSNISSYFWNSSCYPYYKEVNPGVYYWWSEANASNGGNLYYGMEDLAYSIYVYPESLTSLNESEFSSLCESVFIRGFVFDKTELGLTDKNNAAYYIDLNGSSNQGYLWMPSSYCYAHPTSSSGYVMYQIYQCISITLDTDTDSETYGEFITTNTYMEADEPQTIKGTDGNSAYLAKLSMLIYKSISEYSPYEDTSYVGFPLDEGISYLLYYAYNNNNLTRSVALEEGMDSADGSIETTSTAYETINSTSATNYARQFENYKAIQAVAPSEDSNNSTTYTSENTEYCVVGPITLTFGYATISEVTVSDYTGGICYVLAENISSSGWGSCEWESDFSEISPGTVTLYLRLKVKDDSGTYITDLSSIEVTFTQSTISYFNSKLIAERSHSENTMPAQTTLFFTRG